MISSTFDKNKVFTLMWSEIENRIDTAFYTKEFRKIFGCKKYPMTDIRKVVIEFFNGFAAGKDNQSEYGILQIRPTNLVNDELNTSKSIYVENCQADYLVRNKDVLFNNTNSRVLVGKTIVYKLTVQATVSNHITVLRVNENLILPDYLAIILNLYQRKKIFYNICTNWNNQSGINYSVLKKIKIPLPNLQIQSEIINVYNSLVNAQKAKLKQSEELLKSIDTYLLSELNLQLPELKNDLADRKYIVNSKEVIGRRLDPSYHSKQYELFVQECSKKNIALAKLKDISFNIYQGVGRCLTEDKSNILLKVKNILPENQIDYFDIEYVDNPPKNKQLQVGDIISPFIGEAIRQFKFSIFNNNNGNYFVDNNTGVIRVKNRYDGLYVCAILNSSIMKFQIERLIGGGVPFIGTTGAKELLIPIVDFQVQSKIAFHIQQVYDKIKNLKIEAQDCLDSARTKIEQIILGE